MAASSPRDSLRRSVNSLKCLNETQDHYINHRLPPSEALISAINVKLEWLFPTYNATHVRLRHQVLSSHLHPDSQLLPEGCQTTGFTQGTHT